MAMICSVGMFGENVTIPKDCLEELPTETREYIMNNSVEGNISSKEVDNEETSIGTEIGIAVNETFKAISDNTIKLAESNLGKSAIFMLSWKILYKDIIGLIVGIFLLIAVAVITVKVLNQIEKTEKENDGDFTNASAAKVLIGCITSFIFFISSMCCIF